ncbi:alpha-2-macroglobulin-like protein 1 [Haliotis cracherodii]|uniref:alpha-2-macroglobulin-like protein 1 n=1 Tax=Haliotis cracherodii TaxID=6455 RepID=UPI0039ED83A7
MLAALLFIAAAVVVPSLGNNNGSYLLMMPKEMEVGKQQKICLTLYKYNRMDVYYTLESSGNRYFYRGQKYRKGKGGCITFTIPTEVARAPNKLVLSMVGPGGVLIHSSFYFTTTAPQRTTYIHSDKPIYKPGQLVRFRIMTIDSDLMPVLDKISVVRIITPSDVIMKQWRDLENGNGMLTLEFQLAAEPLLGDWMIMVETGGSQTRAMFKVSEYVLPKFVMTLSPPKRVDDKTETITGEVCCKYTYGQPVKGKVMVETCVTDSYQTYSTSTRPCAVIHGEMTGCFTYSFDAAFLRPQYQRRYNSLKISTFAAVLEEATGLMVNQTKEGPTITTFSIHADVGSHTRKYFKPQLPFEYRALVTNAQDGIPAAGHIMTLTCAEIGFDKKILTDKKGFATYFFPRVGTEKPKIKFVLTDADATPRGSFSFEATQWFSPSDSYIEIQPISKLISPGLQPIVLYLTNPPKKAFRVVTQVMSRGRIMHHSHNKYTVRKQSDGTYRSRQPWCRNLKYCSSAKRFAPDVPNINVYVNVSCAMAPEATLLVYRIRSDGEVIADIESFKVEQCFRNPVKMAFTPSKEYPGYPTQLSLTAAPGSLCMVGVVDKSVYVLGGKNQITPQQLFSPLDRYNAVKDAPSESPSSLYAYCQAWFQKHGVYNSDELKFQDRHYDVRTRFTYMSHYVDSSVAFTLSSLKVIGPLELRTRPCKKRYSYDFYRRYGRSLGSAIEDWQSDQSESSGQAAETDESPSQGAPDPKKKTVALRQYFPETWLWDLEIIGDSGKLELNKTLPGSITEWVGSTVCAKSDLGVGVSESASVTAFQPFFVSFTLPYSAIRGEYISVIVSVFNYLTECIEIELKLNESSEFDLLNSERNTWMCICGNEAKRHEFVIIPRSLGQINITAQAKSVPGDSQCPKVKAAGEGIGVKDAVVRQLLVEPEGDEQEYTYSTMVCSEKGTEFFDSIDLPLPADQAVVPDSGRGMLSAIGDLMGPSFSNIGDLLRVPYGCGEQNMINFAPNVFIMRYLKATNQLTPEISETINKYLGSGYQRELNYMRDDGSFSAFGNSDRSGSTWLTAFVIKSFTEAQPFLEIDENVLRRARLWLKAKQARDTGCFTEVGRVIHSSMRGGVNGANSHVTLTAFVMGALITGGTPKSDPAILNAINCIAAQPITDVYTMAAAAYATSLQDANSRVHVNLQRGLHSKAVINGTLMHWETRRDANRQRSYYYRASSLNVETTAYALLAYLEEDDLESSLKVVKWLQKQRNPKGGFASTQDTVIALDALSRFARSTATGNKHNLLLTVEGKNVHKNFTVSKSNSMVMQTEPLNVPNEITLSGVGTGCALFQATVRYNTYDLDKVDLAFTLNATVQPPDPAKPDCSRRTINICTAYVKGGSSGMSIVNAKMVTGWLVATDSLEGLRKDPVLQLKRYEVDSKNPNSVHFYFDELSQAARCFSFEVTQEIRVENTKEAVVQVYDYYDTELVTKVFYNIKSDCKSKGQNSTQTASGTTTTPSAPTTSDLSATVSTDSLGVGELGGVFEVIGENITEPQGEEEEGSGVLSRIDPVWLAAGFKARPNSVPVVNLYNEAKVIDFAKEDADVDDKEVSTMEVKAVSGSKVSLPCHLGAPYTQSPDQRYSIAWVAEQTQELLTLGRRNLVNQARYSVMENYSLIVTDISLEDSGKYQCQVNTDPVQKVVVNLIVQESPVIVASSNDTFAAMGEEVTLYCNVTGSPEPKITWYQFVEKRNRKKVGKGPELVILSAQASATYQCVASNGVPQGVSTKIQLKVSVAPLILPKTQSRVGGHLNKSVLLECVVKASPPLTQRWTKGGRVLFSGDKYSFKTISLDTNTYSTELRINDLVRRDYDDYTCEISNEYGVVSWTITLYDTTPTPAPTTTPEPTTPSAGGCPSCEALSGKQATYAYCQAAAAYKVLGIRIRKSRVKVKILADFRSVKRVKTRHRLRLVIDSKCSCDLITKLKPRAVLALFMMKRVDLDSKPRELIIGAETSAILLPKTLERKLIRERTNCTKLLQQYETGNKDRKPREEIVYIED